MLVYFAIGLWTWFCLSMCRKSTFKGANTISIIKGLAICILIWPIAPFLIDEEDEDEDEEEEDTFRK